MIEDSVNDAHLIYAAIKPYVETVTMTRTLKDGLDHLRRNKPDVILLDVGLPGYTNPDSVIAAVKGVRDEMSAIVVLSGNDDPDVITRALIADCAGWIVKGRWHTLLLEIRAAADNHRHHMRRVKQNQELRMRAELPKPMKA